MVWGTGAARRHEHTPDPDFEAPIPQSAICACGATVLLAAGRLPGDWQIVDGAARCGDCLRGTVLGDLAVNAASQDQLRRGDRGDLLAELLRRGVVRRGIGVGTAEAGRYRGCRIGHEIVCGLAALDIRAGASTPAGRDERVQFLLDPHELDQLMIHLHVIRAELTASQPLDAAKGALNG